MIWTRFKRIVTFGWQGIVRNGWLTFIAVMTLALTIMAISVMSVLNMAENQVQKNLENKLDIAIFFKDAAPEEQVVDFVQQINQRGDVKEVTYVNKDQAKQDFLNENQTDQALTSAVNELDNPFPRYVRVQVDQPSTLVKLNDFADQASYAQVVDSTSYQETQDIVANFVNTAKFTRLNAIVVTVFFTLYSVVIIFNMIRLAIFSRREEVEIMRIVGATNTLVRIPFVMEGVFFGIIGGGISLVLLWVVSRWESVQIARYFAAVSPLSLPSALYTQYFWPLLWLNIFGGIILASAASYLAVRRYLKV